MFGMKLISVESVILKYLPKKVAHSMTISSVDVSSTLYIRLGVCQSQHSHLHTVASIPAHLHLQDIADLVRKEPSHVSMEWVLRLVQHYIESDPDQTFIIDLVPSLR